MADPRAGEGKYMLEHLVPESKKVVAEMARACQRDVGIRFMEF